MIGPKNQKKRSKKKRRRSSILSFNRDEIIGQIETSKSKIDKIDVEIENVVTQIHTIRKNNKELQKVKKI